MCAAFVYSVTSDLSQLSMSFLLLKWGWVTPETRWAEYLVDAGRSKSPGVPDPYLVWGSSYMGWLLRVQRQGGHASTVCATGSRSHWSTECRGNFVSSNFVHYSSHSPQSFVQYFIVNVKGIQCDFVIASCIDP